MIRRTLLLLLFLFALLPAASSQAQATATEIASMTIDFWPDYDRSSVLVLLTGTLPAGTDFPATVTMPLPDNANFSVVARIDASDNQMKDDIEFNLVEDAVTFITPDPRFRVEYYLPYQGEALQRNFNFTWLADVVVNDLEVTVQQPTAATAMLTEPAAVDVLTGQDGFTYHRLPAQVVPAGQPYAVSINYTMSSSQLSAERAAPSITEVQTTGLAPASSSSQTLDWPIIAAIGGGLLIVIAVTWQIASARATSRPRKPRPVRAAAKSKTNAAQYCHICGQPLQLQDKFCRECGTAAKGK